MEGLRQWTVPHREGSSGPLPREQETQAWGQTRDHRDGGTRKEYFGNKNSLLNTTRVKEIIIMRIRKYLE